MYSTWESCQYFKRNNNHCIFDTHLVFSSKSYIIMFMNKNIPLYILKLGGSVITYKDRIGASVEDSIRRPLLEKIAKTLKKTVSRKRFQLILIHGAGSPGHQLAHKYKLKEGTRSDNRKLKGSIFLQNVNQKFDNAILKIFIDNGLNVTPIHTASVIVQNNKNISYFYMGTIKEALKNNCIPILYGEMVFDVKLGMTVCSGDAIASYLAKRMEIRKIFFASDIDGIFTEDPHLNKNARLIEEIDLKNIEKKIKLSQSHNIDVSDGLRGKINEFKKISSASLESIEIFNGLNIKNYEKALSGKPSKRTIIKR